MAIVAVLVLSGIGAVVLDRGLGTCEWLDRWFDRSGCVAQLDVADFRPLGFHTMVPAGDTTMRLFGFTGRGDDASSVQIAFDWTKGRESARSALTFGPLNFLIRGSYDSGKVAAICTTNDACDARLPRGIVIDAASGNIVEELQTANAFDWSFPDQAPHGPVTYDAAVLTGSNLLVEPDPQTGGIRLLRLSERTDIARLAPPDPYEPGPIGPSALVVRASPDGRHVVLVDNRRLYPSGGSRLDVWDIAERRLVCSLVTDARHRLDTNATWTGDNRHLVAFRNWTDMTREEQARDSPLYVFELC